VTLVHTDQLPAEQLWNEASTEPLTQQIEPRKVGCCGSHRAKNDTYWVTSTLASQIRKLPNRIWQPSCLQQLPSTHGNSYPLSVLGCNQRAATIYPEKHHSCLYKPGRDFSLTPVAVDVADCTHVALLLLLALLFPCTLLLQRQGSLAAGVLRCTRGMPAHPPALLSFMLALPQLFFLIAVHSSGAALCHWWSATAVDGCLRSCLHPLLFLFLLSTMLRTSETRLHSARTAAWQSDSRLHQQVAGCK
jgi:hypothetical protein